MIKQLQPAGNLLRGLSFKDAVFGIGADGPKVMFGEADRGYALMPIARAWW